PMTILRNSIDNLTLNNNIDPQRIANVEEELTKLETIITDFLEWAVLENEAKGPELHSIPLAQRSKQICQTITSSYPKNKIVFENKSSKEIRVLCNPIHFDQLLTNLITNAIKYGDQAHIQIYDDSIWIKDEG